METIHFQFLPQPPLISFGEQKTLPLAIALNIFSYSNLTTLHQWQRVNKNWRASLYSFVMMESMALHCLIQSVPRWILMTPNITIPSKYDALPSYEDFKKIIDASLPEDEVKDISEKDLNAAEEAEQIQETSREWESRRSLSTTLYDFSLIYQGLMSTNVMIYPLALCPKKPEMQVIWKEHLLLKHPLFVSEKLQLAGGQSFKIKAIFENVHPQPFYQILKNLKKKGNSNSFQLLLRLYKIEVMETPKCSFYLDALNKAIDYLNDKNQLKSKKEDQHLATQHVRFAKAITTVDD